MAKRKPAAAPAGARVRLGDLECGDVVRAGADLVVVFGLRNSRTWVRHVDGQFREISEPRFLDPDLRVELVRRGVERYAPGTGGEIDPLKGA